MRKLKWYQTPFELVQDFKFENNNIIYKNDLISLDIKLIPYLLITGGKRLRLNIFERGTKRRIPFITIALDIKLHILNKTSNNFNISQFYDRNQLMGLFLYEDIFEQLLKRGFQGEIYVVSDLYNSLKSDWVEYARQGLLNFEKINVYDTYDSCEYK